MATDPTKRIRSRSLPNPFGRSPDDVLDTLAHLPAAKETPYLTVSVDWRVEGTAPGRSEPTEVKRSQNRSGVEEGERQRPALTVIERELDDLIDEHGPRGAVFDSLTEDKDRILQFLQGELDPAAHGALIVANAAQGVFEATGLALPLETRVVHAATPSLYKLVRLVEDNPAYAVLLADQREATLYFIANGQVEEAVDVEGSEYPRKTQQGGWSQRRYQARADERVEAFARDIAEEMRRAIAETSVETIILAGDEVITSPLNDAFHDEVRERVAETIRLDIRSNAQDVLEATLPLAIAHERQREADAVSALQDAVGAGDLGVSGPGETIRALQSGQVHRLLMLDTFTSEGWADYAMDVYGVGPVPQEHPFGGDTSDLVAVELRDEMVRLALDRGGDIDIIHTDVEGEPGDVPQERESPPMTEAARGLMEFGGVGATLRYSMYDGENV